MMPVSALLLLTVVSSPHSTGAVASVRLEPTAEGQTAVILLLARPEVPVAVRSEGSRVIVAVAGGAPAGMWLPQPLPPIVSMRVDDAPREAGRLVLELSQPVRYDTVRDGRELRLVLEGRVDDQLEALAQALFPPERRPANDDLARQLSEPPGPRSPRVRLQPSASVSYASGTNGFEEGPTPQADSYYELAPRLEAESGPLSLGYEAHARRGSRYQTVNDTVTHLFETRVDHRLAGESSVSAHYVFLRGRQQTREVDPGGEYFYGFRPFDRQGADARASLSLGTSTSLVFGADWSRVSFDGRGAFLDYKTWSGHGGLRREIGGATALELRYLRGEVYDSDHAEVAGTSYDMVDAMLSGELRPMLTVHLEAGIARRRSPGAADAARAVTDLLARVVARRELPDGAALELSYERARNISAFERNASYRTDAAQLTCRHPLRPFRLAAVVSGGVHWNSYPLAAVEIGAPRRDRILGWGAGLGRALGSKMQGRIEYQWQRRRSNVKGLSSVSHGLMAVLEVTPLREGSRP